jgi:hypothetical protein
MSNSIFDLKSSVEELSSANEGTSRMDYDQQPPTRSIQGANFPNGAIHFRWETSGAKWWLPSRSYLRMRCLLGKADGTPLEMSDGIAPNMASLFQNMEFRINDKTVSRVSDFVPQIDAIETRISKSASHIDSVAASANFWQDQFKIRQQQVIVDGDNKVIADLSDTRLALGYDPLATTAIAADTGVLTFGQAAGAALPDATAVWLPGDIIELVTDDGGFVNYPVTKVIDADNLQLGGYKTIALDADVHLFERIRKNTIKDNTSRTMTEFEITWQPPLSIFKIGHALPSMRCELVLNPQTASTYKKYAIQSVLASKIPNLNSAGVAPSTGAQFQFEVKDMYMYVNTVEGPRYDNGTYLLDLEQTSCMSEKITTNQFAQRNFDVSPSTYALSAAYQDVRAGTDTRCSPSQFRSYNVAITATQELRLNRFFISYAGMQFPSPDASPDFTPTLDHTVQRYIDTQMYSGAYYDTGGAETIEQWHERGAYYYFSCPRDGTDRSTRVTVNSQFTGGEGAPDIDNMRLLLFAHSKQIARIRVVDGRVVDIQIEYA